MNIKARPLRRRITSFVAFCILIIVIIAEIANGYTLQQVIVNNHEELLQAEVADNSKLVNNWLEGQSDILTSMMESLKYMDEIDEDVIMDYLETQLALNSDALMYYVCFAYNKSVLPADHSELDLDPTERGWWKAAIAANGLIYTDPYCDFSTGKMIVSIAEPFKVQGKQAVILADITIDKLLEMVNGAATDESTQIFMTASDGSVITHPNSDFMPKESGNTILSDVVSLNLNDTSFHEFTDYDGKEKYVVIQKVEETSWSIGMTKSMELVTQQIYGYLRIFIILIIVLQLCSMFVLDYILKKLLGPVTQMVDTLVHISDGNFEITVEKSKRTDEIGVLQNTVANLLQTIKSMIGDTNYILGEIVQRNLQVKDMQEYPGDFNRLAKSVNEIKHILKQLLAKIQQSATNVQNSAAQFSMASDNLSEGTISQAASIEKLQADVTSIAESIQENSDSCVIVNNKLSNLDAQIKEGNSQMEELSQAVEEIESMSNDIQKIVETIDSIAFKTNILALNAAVEAARVGQAGQGFAVVAEEVRNLAYRCSEESQKTGELIEDCINAINRAKEFADRTSGCMNNVVTNADEISEKFQAILTDTERQSENAMGIQNEIVNISDVVQTNTATTEETAASSKILAEEATKLDKLMMQFKI